MILAIVRFQVPLGLATESRLSLRPYLPLPSAYYFAATWINSVPEVSEGAHLLGGELLSPINRAGFRSFGLVLEIVAVSPDES
jgi:hypothetical protein